MAAESVATKGQCPLAGLTPKSRALLSSVDPYALDLNVFLFEGIQRALQDRAGDLCEYVEGVITALPLELRSKVWDASAGGKLALTTTALLQLRLLDLLRRERHRRDIEALNVAMKAAGGRIPYLALGDASKYEIKSPYYKAFVGATDEYADKCYRLALLQCIEYDYEHADICTDDELVELFCSDALMAFKLDAEAKPHADTAAAVDESAIVRVFLPEAVGGLSLGSAP